MNNLEQAHAIEDRALEATARAAFAPLGAETTENLCQNPTANREWAERLAAHPNDPLLIHLFACRQSLCLLTDQGLLAVDQAADLFEKERDKAIEQRQRENAQRQGDPVL